MKSASPISPVSPNAPSIFKAFLLASRPKTWSASLCPVSIGAAVAAKEIGVNWPILALTALFALLIQIGTNFANDYFDFMKGADTEARKGPKRAVQQGWISPRNMIFATVSAFSLAVLFALPLMIQAGLWSFGVAALSVLLGILYTGGPKPFGYLGLGELFVFIFFGPVAVVGTYFLQTNGLSWIPLLCSLPPGFLAAAILMANNLRDAKTDAVAGKKTLVVRFGSPFGKGMYLAFLFFSFLTPLFLISLQFPRKLILASLILLFAPLPKLFRSEEVLQETSLLLLGYTLLFCILL